MGPGTSFSHGERIDAIAGIDDDWQRNGCCFVDEYLGAAFDGFDRFAIGRSVQLFAIDSPVLPSGFGRGSGFRYDISFYVGDTCRLVEVWERHHPGERSLWPGRSCSD